MQNKQYVSTYILRYFKVFNIKLWYLKYKINIVLTSLLSITKKVY